MRSTACLQSEFYFVSVSSFCTLLYWI